MTKLNSLSSFSTMTSIGLFSHIKQQQKNAINFIHPAKSAKFYVKLLKNSRHEFQYEKEEKTDELA